MKAHHHHHHMSHFLILSLVVSLVSASATIQDLVGQELTPRRILHEPLFPVTSTPPPAEESPPPPPPDSQVFPNPDQPFFPEVPTGQTPDQTQSPPPPPPINGTTAVANPIATQPTKPAKKVAIAISVGIVTLGMLSALAFYLYKHRVKLPGESQKLVGGNSQRIQDESRMAQSTFLYIGTVEPSTQTSVTETNEANRSPYRKLSSVKRSDRYRPSPELQPLPPLAKPPLSSINSPPPMSSSDEEESPEVAFYTSQCSTVSNDEEFYTPGSCLRNPSNNSSSLVSQAKIESRTNTSSHPHSKRTSPKSRLSVSSPDMKQIIIPSIRQPLPPPSPPSPAPVPPQSLPQEPRLQYSQPTFAYSPKRPKFSSPPPPPDMTRLQAISNPPVQTSKIPIPPPPPPPPLPPLSTPQKLGGLEINVPLVSSKDLRKSQSTIPNSKAKSGFEKARPVEKENRGASSSERTDADDADGLKPKLKPLHWDKVRATSDRITVWDQMKSSSFQLDEDMMETLFGCNSMKSVPKAATRRSVLPPVERENRVLDPKKSQNLAILLRALNVTRDEVSEALLDAGNPEGLSAELLENLVKMAPTKEEEIKLRDYKGEISKLGSAERFLKAVLDIPFAFKRVEAMLYRANFDTEVKFLRNSFQTLEAASEELKNSRLFLKLLEAVLRTGNRMNVGTNRGDATAFKLDTLLKLVDIKGTDGKTTLLHFVVQEIIRSEGAASDPTAENLPNKMNSILKEDDFKKQGLQVVAGLSRELGNVKKSAGMDSDVLSSYVSKLEMGLEKVRVVLQFEKPNMQGKFFESMKMFLKEAEEEITRIKADERNALSSVKEVTEYFHGDTAKEEAHPFRIFMIVRDFLSVLDHVCKEVGKMKDAMVGSARSFRIPATASLPVLSRYNVRQDTSDEESSS